MQQVEAIRSVHEYNRWANQRVLECAANLTVAQFVADDDLPWGSIRNQFVHQTIVHKSWLSWADGSLPGEQAYALVADPADFPDLGAVRRMWDDVWTQTSAFLERMTPDDLDRLLTVESPDFGFSVPVWKVMMHIANHSMQHRTETAMVLSRLGQSPGDLDYIFYAMQEDLGAGR